MEEKTTTTSNDVEKNKTNAALSYLWILCFLPLNKKRSKFAQFHAKQGLILFLLSFATIVPMFGMLLGVVIIIISVMGIIKALNGEWWKIPIVYEWSKKINL